MDHTPSKFVRGTALVVLVIAIGLMALAWRTSESRADDPYSEDLVQVDIGDRGYAIPRNYLSHVTRDADDGHHKRAVLRVLWPGLEPRTPANDQFWRRRYPTRQIRIHIEARGIEGYDGLENLMDSASRTAVPFQRSAVPASYGLLEYSRAFQDGSMTRFFVAEDAAYATPQKRPLVFNCSDHTSNAAKSMFDVEILCISEYRLEDNAWIKIHFFMVNLESWREIDAAVRRLINNFGR